MKVDIWLDERGRRCPLPVVALMRATSAAEPGAVIAVLSDDPAAAHDIPAWCRLKGMEFVDEREVPDGGAGHAYLVRVPLITP